MDVNRLLGDELIYELYVRDRPIGRTVAENRTLLRDALRWEKIHGPTTYSAILDLLDEKFTCEAKLTDLEQAIANFSAANRENDFKRIYTRLLHVAGRLNRLTCNEVDPEIDRLRLIAKCTRLIGEVSLLNGEDDMLGPEGNGEETNIIDSPVPTLERNPVEPRRAVPVSQDLIDLEAMDNNGPSREKFSPQQEQCSTQVQPQMEPNMSQSRTRSISFGPMLDWATRYPVQPLLKNPNAKMGADIHSKSESHGRPDDHRDKQLHYDLSSGNSRLATGSSVDLADKLAELQLTPDPHLSKTPYQLDDFPRRRTQEYIDPYGQPRFYPTTHVDISRWNLKFNGRTSVNDFLERVEEIRNSRKISKSDLLRFAPELLTHEALLWYRTRQFETWDDLCQQLKEAFRPYDYEFSLWDEIRHRTQGSQEKVLTFITAMENLFRKLEQPLMEKNRVEIMRRNLLPHIQTQIALQKIESTTELTKLARAVEETEWRTKRFTPPPTNYGNLLEPELAYRRPINTRVAAVRTPATPEGPSPSLKDDGPKKLATMGCWNCGSTDHKFRNCRAERKRFCYRCGQPNVFSDNCPKCSKNGKKGQR